MTNVLARMRAKGKNFEIMVDIDKALKIKRGEDAIISEAIQTDVIFSDIKKGMKAGDDELQKFFSTKDVYKIAEKIIKDGEIQIPAEYKEKQREGKAKQIVDFIVTNAVDPRTGRPYTTERIERSLDEAGANITNKPIESQIKEIIEKLSVIIPIKIETKKVKITIPAQYTGQAYGILQSYKESEEWLGNGNLVCILNIPIGIQIDFYDKLNAITHGAALSEEIKQNEK